jgi:hypothetical protein
MRIRVSFKNPISESQENYLLVLPKEVDTVFELEKHLFKKLHLEEHFSFEEYQMKIRINGYQLIDSEKISGLILPDDVLQYFLCKLWIKF